MSRKVRCLVVRVGQEPEERELPVNEIGRAVGGDVQLLLLDQMPYGRQVVAFVRDDGVIQGLPANRILPTAIPYFVMGGPPTRFVPVNGDFLVCAATRAGNEASLEADELAEWRTRLALPHPSMARGS